MRSTAPTRLGTISSQNVWPTLKLKPTDPRLTTTMLIRLHTVKPRFSARMEKNRFLRAILLPVASQNDGSSGSQCSIHRPPRFA